MTNPDDKNLEILDAIYHEAALVEAEEGTSSKDDRQWASQVRANLEARVAELRRNLNAASARPAKPIRPSILAMMRDALLARIEELVLGGRVQVAHRNLSALSDDDLRRLLETIDPQSE